MFTLKKVVEFGIEMGMTEFAIKHYSYEGAPIVHSADTILDFIKGFEDEVPINIKYGTDYCGRGIYFKPHYCFIEYRLADEELPTR